jgi:hypothetical protein
MKRRFPLDDPVQEDHRHRVLEDGERERAEEDHRREQQPADALALVEELRELADDRARLPWHQPLQVAADGREQLALVDDLREREDDEDQERDDREQRVVRDRAREQQALVGLEALQRLPGEVPRVAQHVLRRRPDQALEKVALQRIGAS